MGKKKDQLNVVRCKDGNGIISLETTLPKYCHFGKRKVDPATIHYNLDRSKTPPTRLNKYNVIYVWKQLSFLLSATTNISYKPREMMKSFVGAWYLVADEVDVRIL